MQFTDLNKDWQVYITNDTPLHQIVQNILEKTGPAKVFLSSYSISNEAICKLKSLKDEGIITELICILDNSIKKSRIDLANFLNNISDQMSVINNHTKIVLFINEQKKVTLITSANFTDNRRYEVGVICTLENVADVFQEFFEGAIKDGISINLDKYESNRTTTNTN